MKYIKLISTAFLVLMASCGPTSKLTKTQAYGGIYNEKPLTVELPNQVTCTIDTTDVALKGQTVSSSYKPATLDNGINIQVPPFIESGDKIIVDTRTMEYIKKI